MRFELNPALDRTAARRRLDAVGRAHVADVLDPKCAAALHECLTAERRWNLVTQLAGRHVDLDSAAMAAQGAAEQRHFSTHVLKPAHDGSFQYLFDNLPVYDAWHKGKKDRPILMAFFEFLNGPEMLEFARDVVGAGDIGFADAQATRYGPGQFLTEHDDGVEGKNRCAAYVFNFTPGWRADWGGLTMFIGADGHVSEAFTPRFNALNLFRVPQKHAVSAVASFAPGYRYSITGWFRSGRDPGLSTT